MDVKLKHLLHIDMCYFYRRSGSKKELEQVLRLRKQSINIAIYAMHAVRIFFGWIWIVYDTQIALRMFYRQTRCNIPNI